MVNSFLHTIPPISSSSQINNYHINDKKNNIDNEKLPSSFSSIQKQEYHKSLIVTATAKNTTNIIKSSTSADPFIHAEETWSIFNNTPNYTNMIQSLRKIISFWIDIQQTSDNNMNALCNSSYQQPKEKNNCKNSSTQIHKKQWPVITKNIPIYFDNKTITSENNIHYYNNVNKVNDTIDKGNNLPLLLNNQENPNSIMVIPFYREHRNSKKNSENHNQSFWSLLSSKNKRDNNPNDDHKNTDGLVIYYEATLKKPAQQKQPSWTFTHSYVRDTRINSAEFRMTSAEQNMIRNSKITRPLKNRRYQQRREDNFFWGQRSCLRIVHNVEENIQIMTK